MKIKMYPFSFQIGRTSKWRTTKLKEHRTLSVSQTKTSAVFCQGALCHVRLSLLYAHRVSHRSYFNWKHSECLTWICSYTEQHHPGIWPSEKSQEIQKCYLKDVKCALTSCKHFLWASSELVSTQPKRHKHQARVENVTYFARRETIKRELSSLMLW